MLRVLLTGALLLGGCAYKFGYSDQNLPLNIKKIHIPPFENETMFVGPELDFTNQLVREFERSRVGELVPARDKEEAEAVLQGRVISIQRIQKSQNFQSRDEGNSRGLVNLPRGTFLTTEYLLRVKVELLLRKPKTKKVVWKQWFTDETIYPSARIVLENINTANANYTYSEEQRVIQNLAEVMMQEAVTRLTEGF